jgi:hypothetical protein
LSNCEARLRLAHRDSPAYCRKERGHTDEHKSDGVWHRFKLCLFVYTWKTDANGVITEAVGRRVKGR